MVLVVAHMVGWAPIVEAGEARIYVIREADGSLRFTNRAPQAGEDAEVFTARSGRGRLIRPGEVPPPLSSDSRASLRSSIFRLKGKPFSVYPSRYDDVIVEAAGQHSVDPALVKAVIHAESAFNPHAVSAKGARGLMQLMPATARMLGVRNAFSPTSNIHGGTRYLAQLLRRYRNEAHAIAAYNAGFVPVDRYNGIPPYSETREYVRRVLQLKKKYSQRRNG
jgi:soluble lytic murein transglycosylase-like protein